MSAGPRSKSFWCPARLSRPTAEKPADSRFFGKPLEVKQMIAELQDMVGKGALKIVPEISPR